MKRKWPIQTLIFTAVTGFICILLIMTGLGMNVLMKRYISSRVSSQLSTVLESVQEELLEEAEEGKGRKRFDDHPDRITGTRGNAIILSSDGTLETNIHGERQVGYEIAEYCSEHTIDTSNSSEVISLDSGFYSIQAVDHPVNEGQIIIAYVDVTSLMALTHKINLMLAGVIVIAVILSIVFSRSFARYVARPVKELSDYASEIGNGNLSMRTFSFQDQEFDHLALSMNQMAQELSEEKTKQELFFQNVSHELRTPLTSIHGNAEGIVYGLMEPVKAGEVILKESERLSTMVDDILYLSRLNKKTVQKEPEPVDLRDVLSSCAVQQDTVAKARDITFHYDFDHDAVMCPIKEEDAWHLFSNLISNAVRYAKTKVELICQRSDEHIVVQIKDDGPGVPENDIPHIFERFYKGTNGKHGIGLAIARAAAQNAGGDVIYRYEDGAIFEVSFPSKRSHGTAA